MTQKNDPQECCPQFDPTSWDAKLFDWDNKRFIKDKVFTVFYMPVNFGAAMKRLNAKVEAAGAEMPDWLCLSDHTSMWNMDLYLAVDREVKDAENVRLSGKFISKVYEGQYKESGKWRKDFAAFVKGEGHDLKKTYMWYTTCPKCAKKWGKNYVVFIGKIN
jgi:hypothetical protein